MIYIIWPMDYMMLPMITGSFTFCVHQIELHAHCYSCAELYKPNFCTSQFVFGFHVGVGYMLLMDSSYLQDKVIDWF
jgi:hypothetical protein